jgi:U3 small nucleolar RNA-associated protein 7
MKDEVKRESGKAKKGKKAEFKPHIDGETFRKFARGNVEIDTKVKNTALRSKLEHTKSLIEEAALTTAATDVLLPSSPGGIELDDERMKVFKLQQREIVHNVDLNTAKNAFGFQLQNFGPYQVNFTRNGRLVPNIYSLDTHCNQRVVSIS